MIGAQLAQSIPRSFLALKAWPTYVVLFASCISFYLLIMSKIDFYLNQPSQYVLAGVIIITWIQLFQAMKRTDQAA